MRSYAIARLGAASLLFLAIADLPYDYYTLMRFAVCGISGYGSYVSYRVDQTFWAWAFGAIALLLNPFVPIRLERETWAVLDLVAGGLFLVSVVREYANHLKAERKRRNVEQLAAKAREAEAEADQSRRAGEARRADDARRAGEAVERQNRFAEAERLKKWQERVYKR